MLPVNPSRIPALAKEAQTHQTAGRYSQARKLLETIVATKPDLAVAHFNLATVLLKLDESGKALDHLDRAADLKPDEPAIWKQYATTLRLVADANRTAAFLTKIKKARIDRSLLISLQEMLRPKVRKSNVALGSASPAEIQVAIAHLQKGRFAEAASQAERLSRAHPDISIIADLLAYAQGELGQVVDAESNFKRAIRLDPNYAEARANYGQFLLRQGRNDDAIVELREALRLLPDMPTALTSLGMALFRKGRSVQAIRFLKRSLALNPTSIPTRLELADCLLADFKAEEAAEVVKPILDTPIPNAKHRVLYARALEEMGRHADAMAEFDAAYKDASNKTLVVTAKAGLLQTLGDFDGAEALLRDAIELDPLIGKIYTTLLVTKKLKADDPLISKMEAAYDHPDITPASRMHLGYALGKAMEDIKAYDKVFPYLRAANDEMRRTYPYDIAQHQKSTQTLFDMFGKVDFSLGRDQGKSDFAPIFVTGLPRSGTTLVEQIIASHSTVTGGGEMNYASFDRLNQIVGDLEQRSLRSFDLTDPQLIEIGAQIEARMREAVPGADRITDKGMSAYEMIGPIRAIFPKSRMIVVRRDPRDTLVSMYKNMFQEGRHLYTNSLRDLAIYYRGFVEIIDFWRERLPDAFYEVEYEALIADPEVEARKLIAACDLEWEDQCLAFYENKRPVATLSVHQVRQPLYSSSMQAWRRYEDDLGELFDALGPEFDPRVKDAG